MDRQPLFLSLKGRRVAVIGDGPVAARRAATLLSGGAQVALFAKNPHEEFLGLAERCQRGDLAAENAFDGCTLCYFVPDGDDAPDAALIARAKGAGALVNVADHPELSDFINPSVLDRSPLIVAISTGGEAPLLGRMLKARLETLIPASYGRLAALAGEGRAALADKLASHSARLRFWERFYEGPAVEMALAGDENGARAVLDHEIWRTRPDGSSPEAEVRGEVYLVGAGPGDPDLLTFRAFRLMQKADVVLYDRLVEPTILERVRRDAERIYVGKKRSNHALPQEEIGELMVKLAQQGKRVLRLKGGDPFIFGRGGEEIDKLAEHNIPFQVVPGVTAAAGCSSYAGIPLTHRDYAQSCVFVTGHGKEGPIDLDWSTLLRPNQTVAVYMGLAHLDFLMGEFLKRGADPALPAAIIENGTRSNQVTVTGTIADLGDRAKAAGLKGPTIIIIGNVVKLREKLNWYAPTT
ncbi:uroporphyrin-III C-methyltransferase/precorrin-2 dehydrogenase/sirohydrochlorin ferrochelatase [Rhodoblastus acidophilus]|uniref:siroheme synthase CysG n=1 Tax=Rhodoblastus acidophilus TaxID=1074 RepID=UPI0022251AF2|nr:siroheme synthase CysG [Rhodoblastus acidophilus]MCW2286622.1 uroporphyrin-III C-methyltransferase/precorrin-2 dehydrogenase/sirohydrochlorin ferrochelatase [Rhodoblastus acidophilus]MCW2335466.1 uroporphyrin-III C-methyltransferase/precorrin-2 dehydrogenase/sirohydrochlorin ferrochelatase [Rhodoblastus acidophilus]